MSAGKLHALQQAHGQLLVHRVVLGEEDAQRAVARPGRHGDPKGIAVRARFDRFDGRGGCHEGELEPAALSRDTRAGPVSVPPISSASRRLIAKTESRPTVLAGDRGIGLAERLEQPRHAFLGDAHAGVLDGQAHLPAAVDGFGRRGQRHAAGVGELHRIRQEVQHDLPDPAWVAEQRRGGSPSTPRAARWPSCRPVAGSGRRSADGRPKVERDGLQVEPPGLDLREVEDVVDDRQQASPEVLMLSA